MANSDPMISWLGEDTGTPEHRPEFYDAFDLYAEFMHDILERDDILRMLSRPRSNSANDTAMRVSLETAMGDINKRLAPLDRRLAALKGERK